MLIAHSILRSEPAAYHDKHMFFAASDIRIKAMLPCVECGVRGQGQGRLRGQLCKLCAQNSHVESPKAF